MNTIQLTPGVQLVAAALLRVQQYNIVLWSTAAGLNFGGLNFSAVLISASFYLPYLPYAPPNSANYILANCLVRAQSADQWRRRLTATWRMR